LVPPLVVALPYGMSFILRSAFLRQMVLMPLLPFLQFIHGGQLRNFMVIAALYGLVARNSAVPRFTRGIGLQASTLMMVQIPANFILQFFMAAPGPLMNLAQAAVFGYFVYCLSLCVAACVRGRAVRLPGIGDGHTGGFARPGPGRGGMLRGQGFRGGG